MNENNATRSATATKSHQKASDRAAVLATSSSATATTSSDPMGPELPPSSTTDNSMPSRDFYKASSLLSIWGPCRHIGDSYLSCVVTEGMGMCKPIRRNFEQCATETAEYSIAMLDQISLQACSHISGKEGSAAKRNCAAEFILQQHQQGGGPMAPPPQG